MPKVSRESAQIEQQGPVEDRHADVDGWSIDFVTFAIDIDATEMMKGLPGDQCRCPHWGYVFQGQLTFHTDHGDEVYQSGDAFYLPPGHIPQVTAGTEYLQFSPADQLRSVAEHLARRGRELLGASQPTS